MAKAVTLEQLLTAADPKKAIEAISFEDGLKLVEELVGRVEGGTLPLDVAMHSYEKGVLLVEHLRKLLAGAEEKLKVLRRSSDGKAKVEGK